MSCAIVFATNLVRKGASLDEVRDVLRHRSRASTLIYAKVDIEGLGLTRADVALLALGVLSLCLALALSFV